MVLWSKQEQDIIEVTVDAGREKPMKTPGTVIIKGCSQSPAPRGIPIQFENRKMRTLKQTANKSTSSVLSRRGAYV